MNAGLRKLLVVIALCSACGGSCDCGMETASSSGARPGVAASGTRAQGGVESAGAAGRVAPPPRIAERPGFRPLEDPALRQQLTALSDKIEPEGELGKPVAPESMAGLLRDELSGFRAGSAVSRVEREVGGAVVPVVAREYRQGERMLRLKVTDTTQAPTIRQEFTTQLLQVGDDSTGGQRGLVVRGAPAVRAYHAERKTSRAAVLAGGRYFVEAIVTNTDRPDDALDACKALDWTRLPKSK